MSKIQGRFARTVDTFSVYAVRDTREILAEKVAFTRPQASDLWLIPGRN